MNAAQVAPAPLSPGKYLQLRRLSAGLALSDLALLLAAQEFRPVRTAHRAMLQRRILAFETDEAGPGVDVDFLRRINRYVPFDENLYLGLVGYAAAPDAGLPVPDHCRRCGCSWEDACPPGCSWADSSKSVCSACHGGFQGGVAGELAAAAGAGR